MGYSKIQTNSISIKPSIQNSISLKNVNLISNGNDIFSYPLSNNDELSFIKFNGQLPYNSIVPHKHGEYSLSGSVFASGFVNNDVAPYKAFTYNTTDKWQVDTITGIIGYEFTEPKLIYKYEISCHSLTNINMAPKTWTFEGYNEDTFVWDVLDTQTDIILTATDFTRTIFITNPTTKYKKYRLNITVNNGNATSLSINHIKLYEIYDKLDMDNKVRIELDERTKLYLYKITNGVCDIYEKNSVYEFVIPNTNQEYFIYFYLNDNGSIVFEGNNIYNFKQNSFPLCSIFNNRSNKITNFNKMNKFNYSIIVDVYRYKTTKPTPANSPSVEMYENILYCSGGISILQNEAYDASSDLWTSKTNRPNTLGASAVGISTNHIYVAGGYSGASAYAWHYMYNIADDNWTAKLNLPVSSYYIAGKCIDRNMYAINGYTGHNFNYSYNIDNNTWTTKINKPTFCYWFGCENYNEYIYCISGNFNVIETYDTSTDTWGSKNNAIVNGSTISSKINNNEIYCFFNNSYYNGQYNILLDTWKTSKRTSPNTSYHNFRAKTVYDNIYIIGTTTIEYVPYAPDNKWD